MAHVSSFGSLLLEREYQNMLLVELTEDDIHVG